MWRRVVWYVFTSLPECTLSCYIKSCLSPQWNSTDAPLIGRYNNPGKREMRGETLGAYLWTKRPAVLKHVPGSTKWIHRCLRLVRPCPVRELKLGSSRYKVRVLSSPTLTSGARVLSELKILDGDLLLFAQDHLCKCLVCLMPDFAHCYQPCDK